MASRVATHSENQRAGGSKFNVPPGPGKIVSATVALEQMGEWLAAGYRIGVQPLGKNMKPTNDEPVIQFLPLGGTSTRDGEPLFRAGKAKGPDDENPKVLPMEEDVEGNCLCAEADDLKIDKTIGGAVFCRRLEEKGVPHSLMTGYAPNFIGLVAEWDQEELKAAGEGRKNAITTLRAVKILNMTEFLKEKGVRGGAAAASAGAAASTKKDAKKDAEQEPETEVESDVVEEVEVEGSGDEADRIDGLAQKALTKLTSSLAGQTVTKAKARNKLIVIMPQVGVAPKDFPAVQTLFGDDQWLARESKDAGWKISGDNVTVPVPKAAA